VTAVYHSRAPFARLLEATMPGRAPAAPRLDWSQREVIVIALGPRSSTGYSLRILRIVERRRGIDVYAREQTPSLGDPVEPRVTYPYRALAIHGSAKPVYVKLQGRP
jgi:protease stability complex PrcB-like protein